MSTVVVQEVGRGGGPSRGRGGEVKERKEWAKRCFGPFGGVGNGRFRDDEDDVEDGGTGAAEAAACRSWCRNCMSVLTTQSGFVAAAVATPAKIGGQSPVFLGAEIRAMQAATRASLQGRTRLTGGGGSQQMDCRVLLAMVEPLCIDLLAVSVYEEIDGSDRVARRSASLEPAQTMGGFERANGPCGHSSG